MLLNHLKNMNLSTRILTFIIFLSSLPVLAASSVWTLEDCMAQAKKASLKLESSKLNEESASISLKKAKSSRYPDLSANINNSLYDSPFNSGAQDHYRLSLGISSSMNLWDGGATNLNIQSNTLKKQSSSFETEQIWQNIQESVLNAYVSLLAAQENIQVAELSLLLAEEELKRIQYLYDVGSVTQKDLVLAKSDLSQKKVSVLLAEQTLDNQKTLLRQLLEIPRDDLFEIKAPEWDVASPSELPPLQSLEELYGEIRKKNPGLQADSINVLVSEKEKLIASKTSSINVSLGASASTGLTAWESNAYGSQMKNGYTHSISLGVNIPIIDNGVETTNVLQAQVGVTQAQLNKRETEKNLENVIETLYMNAKSADLQWEAALLQKEAEEEAYRVVEEQRLLGLISYTDFLEQKNKLESAQLNLNNAKYNSLLMRKRIDIYRMIY
jgi:outer membrane protein